MASRRAAADGERGVEGDVEVGMYIMLVLEQTRADKKYIRVYV